MAVTFSAGNRWQGTSLNVSDSKTFTLSTWFKFTALGTQGILAFHNTVDGSAQAFLFSLQADGDLAVSARDSGSSTVLSSAAASQSLSIATWYHVLIAVDLADSEPVKMYLDGTKLTTTDAVAVDAAIDFSTTSVVIGAGLDGNDEGVADFNGVIDELWFSTTYLDPDDSDILGRFVGPLDEQIGLGHQGRTPLSGGQPEIFLTHGAGNFGRNEGSAGDLSAIGSTTSSLGRPATVETLSRGFRGERWRESERSGIPFPESRLAIESASDLEVALRELSTDRDEINRRSRRRNSIFEY